MPRADFRIPAAPGTERRVAVLSFGATGARPKAYIQAALHAEELNGSLVIERLAARLAEAEGRGDVCGEVVLVPHANPIGLAQWQGGRHLGRFRLSDHQNFNRAFPNLSALVDGAVDGETLPNLRRRLAEAAAGAEPADELDRLRRSLLARSVDGDVILDLHQEDCGILHLYQSSPEWPSGADLAAHLGAGAVILNEADPANLSFSEANALPWIVARRRGLVGPDEMPVVTTVELRGRNDATPERIEADADAILRFLAGRGFISGPAPAPPAPVAPSPLAAMDVGYAPFAGVVSFRVSPGERVRPGQEVARVVDLFEGRAADIPARGAGVVFARRSQAALVQGGDALFRIAGQDPLAHRQNRSSVDD